MERIVLDRGVSTTTPCALPQITLPTKHSDSVKVNQEDRVRNPASHGQLGSLWPGDYCRFQLVQHRIPIASPEALQISQPAPPPLSGPSAPLPAGSYHMDWTPWH